METYRVKKGAWDLKQNSGSLIHSCSPAFCDSKRLLFMKDPIRYIWSAVGINAYNRIFAQKSG